MLIPFAPKAILFDMDGILFNTEDLAHELFQKFAKKFETEFTEEDHKAICGTTEKFWSNYLMNKWNTSVSSKIFAGSFWNQLSGLKKIKVKLLPNVVLTLNCLKSAGILMALVTSTPRNHTEEFLERFNLKTYFSFIVTGDEILNGKPSPDPYLVAIKKLNLNSAECIVVEDALSGVRSGKSAGCVVVAIPTQHMDGLDYSEADFIIYDLNDLPPLLGIKC